MSNGPNWTAIIVFVALFALVTILGFVAANWRRGNLNELGEWGLGGRRFGTLVVWFLLGGDLYTAYTFIAVPGQAYGLGSIAFFAIPYTIITYPLVFVFMPRLWSVSRRHHYITASDFIRGRYGSGGLALAVAITGILATMPYIALQLVGIQVVIQTMGITGPGILNDLPIIIAFVILAAYTYTSGLRAPAMIAIVKDILIYISIIAAVIIIPLHVASLHGGGGLLAGYKDIFDLSAKAFATPKAKAAGASFILPSKSYLAFSTLAFGSALALFMYPHAVTGVLSSNSRNAIKRNMAFLPAYSFALGLIALLGYMARATGVSVTNAQLAVPVLFAQQFPSWFAGFAFAAIAIGALVPAAIMAIAASNLFTRNIYKEYFRKNATASEEATTAKLVSLIVKAGALVFIIAIPTSYAIQLQLLGGVWIIEILPALVFGLYTRFFHRWALLIGWAVGMGWGTYMAYANTTGKPFSGTTYALHLFGHTYAGYAALYALIANIVVAIVLTVIFRAIRVPDGKDETVANDFVTSEPKPLAEVTH